MANKDLFKQAIAEAKSVREAAIANAKEALEESLTPHLKDMLAAKLQEMDDSSADEEVVKESEDGEEAAMEGTYSEVEEVEDVEDEAEQAADETEEEEVASEDEATDDEDLSDLSVEDFKDLIRDIISQEMGGGATDMDAEVGADMDAGADIEIPGEGEPLAGEEGDEEIDLDELLAELDELSASEGEAGKEEGHDAEAKDEVAFNSTVNEEVKEELKGALDTIETLRRELNEVNLLNSKLLYVNKIFKANSLSEAQKVNIIAAFDKAETVKEVKLVFETVNENVVTKKETTIKEHKGSASKATGVTTRKPEVINEVSSAILRMQKLAGIIK
jgi:hypothetical protein|tara:strand:- start:335 stop:1330 length:996 start_codon:yes stop_codon:yes gene_type:complete